VGAADAITAGPAIATAHAIPAVTAKRLGVDLMVTPFLFERINDGA
jgi:hypothetical protein